MPKELIHDLNGPFGLEVRWGDSGIIQVATVIDPQSSDSPQNLYDLVRSWTEYEARFATGLSVTLDWSSCNRAIKAIRQARKRTYDEQ